MHGTTMVFLVVMPMSAAFFNLLVPLMIGARDVAFPRLNAFSYWLFLFGGIFLNISFFTGGNFLKGDLGAPDGGWFGYAPLTLDRFSPGNGIDYWMLGLQMLGIASLAGGFNFIVTILNMRAPGMTLFRMPVFVWMTLVTSFLIIFAMPVISVALFELTFDRLFDANFFNASARRHAAALAAHVLALRPPGGVHPHPPGDGHRLGGAADVLAQAAVRLPVRGVLGHRDRLHVAGASGRTTCTRRASARSRTRRSASRRSSSRSRRA